MSRGPCSVKSNLNNFEYVGGEGGLYGGNPLCEQQTHTTENITFASPFAFINETDYQLSFLSHLILDVHVNFDKHLISYTERIPYSNCGTSMNRNYLWCTINENY